MKKTVYDEKTKAKLEALKKQYKDKSLSREERAEALNLQNEDVQYHAAWSNECIEFWFILHFSYYTRCAGVRLYCGNRQSLP